MSFYTTTSPIFTSSKKPVSVTIESTFPLYEELKELREQLTKHKTLVKELQVENKDLKTLLEQTRKENNELKKEMEEENTIRDAVATMLVQEQLKGHARWTREVEEFKMELRGSLDLPEGKSMEQEIRELRVDIAELKRKEKSVEEAIKQYQMEHPVPDNSYTMASLLGQLAQVTEDKETIGREKKYEVGVLEKKVSELERERNKAEEWFNAERQKARDLRKELEDLKSANAAQDNIRRMMDLLD